MTSVKRALSVLPLLVAAASAMAQPRIVTLNPGAPQAMSNDATTAFGGFTRYGVGANTLTVNQLPGTSPSASVCSSDGLFAAGTVSSAASRFSTATGTWTTLPLAPTITALNNVRDIAASGGFVCGQCSTSSPGSFAGWVWNASTNTTTKLLGNTNTARACAVSTDGMVVVGGESPNVAGTTSGGRAGVWRFNAGTGMYDWSYLPDGPSDAAGTGIVYRTVDQFHINDDGTIIVGTSFQYNNETGFVQSWLTRWVWNAGTMTWDRFNLYNMDTGPITISSWWTPFPECPIPPQFFPTGMTNDGNTIIGQLRYSTCGSFISGGFIYTGGQMRDLQDHLVSLGVDLAGAGYGTFNSGGVGLSHLGYALDISDDGQHLVGNPVLDPDAPGGWLIDLNNPMGACVTPTMVTNPTASTNFSACTSSIILNVNAAGSSVFTYQWRKNGMPIIDGPSGNGSTYQIVAGGKQLRINGPLTPADAGSFDCMVSNACGSAVSASGVVQVDPALVAINNDTCAGAALNPLGTGLNLLGAGHTPCAAWVDDLTATAFCLTAAPKVDRWYSFTPTMSQEYRFETCGANFDTVLSVFESCGGNELACNNDRDSGPATVTGTTGSCSSQRSRIDRLALQAGTAYLVRIAAPATAFLSSTSVMNLSIVAAPARPANNACDTATPAVVGANALDTNEATSNGFATCVSPVDARDVWFTFTPPGTGTARMATCPGTSWNTVLTVFDACAGNEVACNDNANVSGCFSQSIVSDVRVNAGTTYLVRVGGNSATAFGTGTLTISFVCRADFNGDGNIDPDDLSDYITCFFTVPSCPAGDFNRDATIDPDDLSDYITSFFSSPC